MSPQCFFNKLNQPNSTLERVFMAFNCHSLNQLQEKCNAGEITLWELCRIRGCGSVKVPGKLAQYLFGVKSREEKLKESVLENLGAGI
jgi:hypothetical protein